LLTKSVESDGETILLPIFAEKRYEHVTGQLCWVFGFAELQKLSEAIWTLKPSFGEWVAVRLRFPQKAWLTYLAIEPEHVLPNLFRITLVIVGYALFLLGASLCLSALVLTAHQCAYDRTKKPNCPIDVAHKVMVTLASPNSLIVKAR
jgi:hypothetical protein